MYAAALTPCGSGYKVEACQPRGGCFLRSPDSLFSDKEGASHSEGYPTPKSNDHTSKLAKYFFESVCVCGDSPFLVRVSFLRLTMAALGFRRPIFPGETAGVPRVGLAGRAI